MTEIGEAISQSCASAVKSVAVGGSPGTSANAEAAAKE